MRWGEKFGVTQMENPKPHKSHIMTKPHNIDRDLW